MMVDWWYTVAAYSAVAAMVGGAYVYYTKSSDGKYRGQPRRTPPVREQAAARVPRRREDKRKPGGSSTEQDTGDVPTPVDTTSSETGNAGARAKKRKTNNKVNQQASAAPAPRSLEAEALNEEESDNKDWARQLADLKKGTSLAPPSRLDNRGKSAKQANAAKTPGLSATSSTTGADADDDLSPALSPSLGETPRNGLSGIDISDMLEAPSAGPSVIRLTESDQPGRTRSPQQQRPAQVEETKKQRQNRKKAEEKKLQREQDEKDRRVLLENQLRTAREARGEPARNGIASAQTPATNAWNKPSQGNGLPAGASPAAANAARVLNAPLLDTFENGSTSITSSRGVNGTSSTPNTNWEREMPSEEEQMRMLNEETGWNTVPKGKKKAKKPGVLGGDMAGNESSDGGSIQFSAPKESVPSIPVASDIRSNVTYVPPTASVKRNPEDSDWL